MRGGSVICCLTDSKSSHVHIYCLGISTVLKGTQKIESGLHICITNMNNIYKCVFYLYQSAVNKPVPQVFDQSTCSLVGSIYIYSDTGDIDTNKLFGEANARLSPCLWRKHIKHFIPLQLPTIHLHRDASGAEEIVIVYYHNCDLYNKIYTSNPRTILMPIGDLYEHLTALLNDHGFDGWEDERARIVT